MDKYYVCRDYMNDFYKIKVEDKKNKWDVAVIH